MSNSENKLKLIVLSLIVLLVFGGLFINLKLKKVKSDNENLKSQTIILKDQNKKLSENMSLMKSDNSEKTEDNKEDLIQNEINKVADKFIELYPEYDLKTIKEKKKKLDKIASSSVSNSIVPDDLLSTSEKLLEKDKDSSKDKGEVYSSDPSFKSKYDSSKKYSNYLGSNEVDFFAEVNYITESSSGDTKNNVYVFFKVIMEKGKAYVSDYEIKYLN